MQLIYVIEKREGLKHWEPDFASPVFTDPSEGEHLCVEWNLKFEGIEHRLAVYVREGVRA